MLPSSIGSLRIELIDIYIFNLIVNVAKVSENHGEVGELEPQIS